MMRWLDYFRIAPRPTAAVAKERLQVIVAHQRRAQGAPEYLPRMQQDLLMVIRKYVNVKDDAVEIQFDRADGYEVLELNIALNGEAVAQPARSPVRNNRRKRARG